MFVIELSVPNEPNPTDLAGYAAYVTGAIALDQPVQIPDFLAIYDPKNGVSAEVKRRELAEPDANR